MYQIVSVFCLGDEIKCGIIRILFMIYYTLEISQSGMSLTSPFKVTTT